ncbi:acyl-CoA dehydrogenase family protein [Streptomyces sp. NPDC090045]|uniref:acyl-CoA dehydrogenase family protein n=1 Tax=Streptomyces sp. NPDC090045 TaxID=3365927 RepID=UPI0037FDA3B4
MSGPARTLAAERQELRELRELRDAVRAVLDRHPGHAAWAPLTAQVGAAALAVPQEYGGLGCGAPEVGVVMAELGRALSPVPYLSSAVLTVQALLASGDRQACARHLPRLAEGTLVGTLAWAESPAWPPAGSPGSLVGPRPGASPDPTSGELPEAAPDPRPEPGTDPGAGPGDGAEAGPEARAGAARDAASGAGAGAAAGGGTGPGQGPGPRTGRGGWEVADTITLAVPDGEGWLLTGTKRYVLAGPAEPALVLVFAVIGSDPAPGSAPGQGTGIGRLGLFELAAAPAAFTVRSTLDRTRPLAELTLDRTPARLLSADGAAVLARVRDLACTALAAEQVGAAAQALELTVRYAKDRIQFGRPIGSFQAVKHRLADMHTAVETAGALAAAAARADAPPRLAAAAKSACSQAYAYVAGEMIQLHGGIGITWEHPAHEFFKRAHGSALLFGSPAAHRARLAADLGFGGPV